LGEIWFFGDRVVLGRNGFFGPFWGFWGFWGFWPFSVFLGFFGVFRVFGTYEFFGGEGKIFFLCERIFLW
jgi:hypothetical protein